MGGKLTSGGIKLPNTGEVEQTKVVVSVTLHVTLDCHSIFLARMSHSRCVGASIDILGER